MQIMFIIYNQQNMNKSMPKWKQITQHIYPDNLYTFFFSFDPSTPVTIIVQCIGTSESIFLLEQSIMEQKNKSDIEDFKKSLFDFGNSNIGEYFQWKENNVLLIKKLNIEVKQQDIVFLNEQISQVFLSYKIIQFISDQANFTQQSEESVRQKIIKFINSLFPSLIHQKARKKLLTFFDFEANQKQRIIYQKQFFKPERFQNTQNNEKCMVFNPTNTTNQIFNYFLQPITTNKLIYGNSGIGKTLSLSLMVKFFRIITDYRITQNNGLQFLIKYGFINWKLFSRIPKVYYLQINENLDNENCAKLIQKQIKNQIPLNNYSDKSFYRWLYEVVKVYDKQFRVMFAIDQINIYHSLMKKILFTQDKQQKQKFINNAYTLSHILTSIDQQFRIIYSSSLNLEQGLVNRLEGKGIYLKQCLSSVQYKRLSYQKFRSSQQGLLQMIHTIFFQYQNTLKKHLRSNNKFQEYQQKVNQKINSLKYLLRKENISQILKENQQIVGKLTHLRMSQYFRQFQDLQELLQLFSNQQPFGASLCEIKLFTIRKSEQKFKLFLTKNKQYLPKRYEFLIYLKEKAIQFIYQPNQREKTIGYFQCKALSYFEKMYGDFSEIINQDNAIIKPISHKIQIFYSPYTFIDMIEQILQDFVVIKQNLASFITDYAIDKTACRSILDFCCPKLISHFQVSFKLNEQIHFIKNQNAESFQQIPENEKKVSFVKKFGDILRKVQSMKLKDQQYIGAYPRLKSANAKQSCNSWFIDCLLITLTRGKYLIKTIDFQVSSQIVNLRTKIQKSNQFFQDLISKANDIPYQIQHYFVIREDMWRELQQRGYLQGGGSIKHFFTPIEKLDIQLTQPAPQNNKKDSQDQFEIYKAIIDVIKGQQ